jgi:hypothetical protein
MQSLLSLSYSMMISNRQGAPICNLYLVGSETPVPSPNTGPVLSDCKFKLFSLLMVS